MAIFSAVHVTEKPLAYTTSRPLYIPPPFFPFRGRCTADKFGVPQNIRGKNGANRRAECAYYCRSPLGGRSAAGMIK